MRADFLTAVDAVRACAIPLGSARADEALLDLVGNAQFVLLGEASHGTHEFYEERARITRMLVERKGFGAVAVEGDWPDAQRVNRYVRMLDGDRSADAALGGFQRFPTWMWRNTVVLGFVEWLRERNMALPANRRCGFYGLDMYSLHDSMSGVLDYLARRHPGDLALARERYACFDRFEGDSNLYGMLTGLRGLAGCEAEVVAMLVDLRRKAFAASSRSPQGSSPADEEDAFDAEQNARLVMSAEAYYRAMYLSEVSSWNLRDTHMAETIETLALHLRRPGVPGKIVVWAHNSHLGDARATEMGLERDELNVGQLLRHRQGDDAVLIGFTTHSGTVSAASAWGGACERKKVLPSRDDSIEHVLHASGIPAFLLPLRGQGRRMEALHGPLLERAIGVIYRPETERQSHYFFADLPRQFDAVIHIDETRALEPIETSAQAQAHPRDLPETFPSGQ